LNAAQDKVSCDDKTKRKFLKAFLGMKKAFSLFPTNPEIFKFRDDLMFFEAIKDRMTVLFPRAIPSLEAESTIKELVSRAVILEDIKRLLETGKIDILNQEFLKRVGELEFPNLRIEILRKLLTEKIRVRIRSNPLRRGWRELLELTITVP
jgi:type I restriction enzyme R subunit